MKTKQRLSVSSLLHLLRKSNKTLAYFFTFCILNLTISCSYYGMKRTQISNTNFSSEYKTATSKKQRYIILHDNSSIKHLTNVSLDDEKKIISADVEPVDPKYHLYPIKEGKKTASYTKSKVNKTLELHFYTNKTINESQPVNLSYSDIYLMEVYEPNTQRTVLNAVGCTLAALALVAIIIAATKSSCPFVYSHNGKEYTFAGEMYPGAILPNLERIDYLPLPNCVPDENNQFSIKITNELQEVQQTDLVELIVVEHPENIEVLLDQKGGIQTISQKLSPKKIISNQKNLILQPALHKDHNTYLFDSKSNNKGINTLELSFKKEATENGKLILSAKNTLWFDYLYGKFNEKFGSYFTTFQEKQRKTSKEELENWRNNQSIPLSVYLKSNGEWKLIEQINPVGPMAFRDIVIPIEFKDITEPTIELKLETGFMFWEVDYIAMDQNLNYPVSISTLQPNEAIDENGTDVTDLLIHSDQNYLIQPSTTNEVTVKFRSKIPKKRHHQSVFLKNKGYYEYIRNYTNRPHFSELKTFREPGRLSEFSEEEYFKFITQKNINEIVFKHE
ncbi:hypothetical protein [Flavobacterium sp. GCM10027622]|uniref:hypothetical protein n=1 Tax=unclassified Flavobacterium TaxID=196869 RepID=UPI00360E5671